MNSFVAIKKMELSIKEKNGRLIREYHIVFKSNKSDINHNLCVTGSLLTAKKYATKNIPESLKHLDDLNIEIYCLDFSKNEPIATKHGGWLPHPLLQDFDFWDFSSNSGY